MHEPMDFHHLALGQSCEDCSESLAHALPISREIHPLDPQPHRHSMLVPRVCAPRVTRGSLGKHWSRDFFPRRWGQQAANPGVHRLSMTHSGRGSEI